MRHPLKDTQLKVLYLFAGAKRRGNLKEWLLKLLPSNVTLIMTEVDVLIDAVNHDLLVEGNGERFTNQIAESQVVVCTPPCSTHSRAVWSNRLGPCPIRSRQYLRGFPWLSSAHQTKADTANKLMDLTWNVMTLTNTAARKTFCLGLVEHPEDLGRVGSWATGGTPASIWQTDEARSFVTNHRWSTIALHQSQYGAPTPKPTRLLFNHNAFDSMGHTGWPSFDSGGRYLGPLPKPTTSPGISIMRKQGDSGPFKTAATASYPSDMCRELATLMISCWQRHTDALQSTVAAPPLPEGGKLGAAPTQVEGTDDLGAAQVQTQHLFPFPPLPPPGDILPWPPVPSSLAPHRLRHLLLGGPTTRGSRRTPGTSTSGRRSPGTARTTRGP